MFPVLVWMFPVSVWMFPVSVWMFPVFVGQQGAPPPTVASEREDVECSLNVPWVFPECFLNVPCTGR
jgi:hypothetical protein